VNLLDAPVAITGAVGLVHIKTMVLELLSITWYGVGQSMTYANSHADGGTMATWAALATFTVGSVVEMVVAGIKYHPFHTHVSPFQITSFNDASSSSSASSLNDDYFQVGDWHDTLQMVVSNNVTVRLQTDKFTGKQVAHCHILSHEDEGMMGFFEIEGIEGNVYANAKTIDPTCYEFAYAVAITESSDYDQAMMLLGFFGAIIGYLGGVVVVILIVDLCFPKLME